MPRLVRASGGGASLPLPQPPPPALVPGTLDAGFGGPAATTVLTPISGYVVPDASHKVVVCLSAKRNGTTDFNFVSVTWNGQNLTAVPGTRASTATSVRNLIEIWYLDSPTPGTGDVVVSTDLEQVQLSASIHLVSNAGSGAAAGDSNAASGVTSLSSSISVPGENHYVVSAYNSAANVDLDPLGTGADLLFNGTSSPSTLALGVADENANTGALSYGWGTDTTLRLCIAAAAFAPA